MTPLQQFKARVKLGTRMELIAYAVAGRPVPHKYLHVERAVGFCGSRDFAFALQSNPRGLSYCSWPKATELTWVDDDTARIAEGGIELTYRFIR